MNNNSGGSVPQKVGRKKRISYERGSASEMNRKLTEALQRLGDPVVNFRARRNRFVKAKMRSKDGARAMSKVYPLRSSHLKSAEHTPEGHLIITFKDGTRYQYKNVPAESFTELLRAKSPGAFLHHAIQGKYKGKPIANPLG
jgi:KTSC domain